jgi:hypothetical protein
MGTTRNWRKVTRARVVSRTRYQQLWSLELDCGHNTTRPRPLRSPEAPRQVDCVECAFVGAAKAGT